MKRCFGKVDLFAPSLGDKEAIIPCSFNFDLKKKSIKKICPPAPTPKSCGGPTKQLFFGGTLP